MAVWPPAQLGSAQMDDRPGSVPVWCSSCSFVQLSEAPPSLAADVAVTPLVLVSMRMTQLPAVVALFRDTDADAHVPTLLWTREIAMAGRGSARGVGDQP